MMKHLTRCATLLALGFNAVTASAQQTFTGQVTDPSGTPLEGIRVRMSSAQGTYPVSSSEFGITGPDGRFSVTAPFGSRVWVGIGGLGYFNLAGLLDTTRGTNVDLELDPVPPIDNRNYQWIQPFFPKEDTTDFGCNLCHGDQQRQWSSSIMAIAAKDPLVLSLYEGADGPAYRKDHPDKAGPCANCHAAAAAANAPNETVLSEVQGVPQEGVFCDVCHKIAAVDPVEKPGVGGSLQLRRPSAWEVLFGFGPFEDVGGPMGSSYSTLIKSARFCAGCHEWTNDFGVPVLSTFSEWSEMSGADPDALQCQDCHMKKKFGADYMGESDTLEFLIDDPHMRQMHGVQRKSSTVYPHEFRGGLDFAAEAGDVTVSATQQGGELVVTAVASNVNAGHALPTGMPFRHAILVVEAAVDGQALSQTAGPKVPEYGGVGSLPEDLAGRPGKGYAKVVGDGTGARNVMFWAATEILEDTRIRAGRSDEVVLRFSAPPAGGSAQVSARFIYRRAFRDLAQQKGWNLDDIEMGRAEAALVLAPHQVESTDDGPALATSDGCACSATTALGSDALDAGLVLGGLLVLAVRARRRGER